jgi:hypothetical protein
VWSTDERDDKSPRRYRSDAHLLGAAECRGLLRLHGAAVPVCPHSSKVGLGGPSRPLPVSLLLLHVCKAAVSTVAGESPNPSQPQSHDSALNDCAGTYTVRLHHLQHRHTQGLRECAGAQCQQAAPAVSPPWVLRLLSSRGVLRPTYLHHVLVLLSPSFRKRIRDSGHTGYNYDQALFRFDLKAGGWSCGSAPCVLSLRWHAATSQSHLCEHASHTTQPLAHAQTCRQRSTGTSSSSLSSWWWSMSRART